LDATEPDVRKQILRLLDGDEHAFEAWLRAELAAIEARREGAGAAEPDHGRPPTRNDGTPP
jgi:hypothetical protein